MIYVHTFVNDGTSSPYSAEEKALSAALLRYYQTVGTVWSKISMTQTKHRADSVYTTVYEVEIV